MCGHRCGEVHGEARELAKRLKVATVLAAFVLVLYCAIAFIVVFVDRNISYHLDGCNIPFLPNVALVAILLGVLLLLRLLLGLLPTKTSGQTAANRFGEWFTAPLDLPTSRLVLIGLLGTGFVTIVQLVVFLQAGIVTGWDAGAVRDLASLGGDSLALPADAFYGSGLYYYCCRYPNNLLLMALLRLEVLFSRAFLPDISPDGFLAAASIFLVALTFLFFVLVAGKFFRRRGPFVGSAAVYLLLVCLSPWAMIPYSDTYGLFMCMLLLMLGSYVAKHPLGWVMIGFLGYVAYGIKPTAIFVLLAFVVARLLVLGVRRRGKRIAAAVFCLAMGLVASFVCASCITGAFGIDWDESEQFSATHYLMLGLNDETDGVYSSEDFDISFNTPDLETREEVNLAEARRRLENFGVAGLAKHELHKVLINFNDGRFAWAVEGHFYERTIQTGGSLSTFLCGILGSNDDLQLYKGYSTSCQILWLITLLGIPFGFMRLRKVDCAGRNADNNATGLDAQRQVIFLTILFSVGALALFLLTFEARARYLYLYGGFYVLLAASGYEAVAEKVVPSKPAPRHARHASAPAAASARSAR